MGDDVLRAPGNLLSYFDEIRQLLLVALVDEH
jgi:hypothetical protein